MNKTSLVTIGDMFPVIDFAAPAANTAPSVPTPKPPATAGSPLSFTPPAATPPPKRRPAPAAQVVDHGYHANKPLFQFFVNQGMVLFNRQKKVLLKHQVIPFADFGRLWYNPDVCFLRTSILMQSEEHDTDADVVFDLKGGARQKQVSRHSYCSYAWNDSMIGITGRRRNHIPAPGLDVVDDLKAMGRYSRFQEDELPHVGKIFPHFYVEIDFHEEMQRLGLSEADLRDQAELHDLMEMFDINRARWGWYKLLTAMVPLVAAQPVAVTPDQIEAWTTYLYPEYATNPIFIASHTVRPDAMSCDFGAIDRDSDYARFIQQPCDFAGLQLAMTRHQMTAETFHVSVNGTDKDSMAFVRHLLDAPARHALTELDYSDAPMTVA